MMVVEMTNGRIVYSKIPDYDSQVASASYVHGGSGGGHGHGHATSYHNQVLYSYHPVKVHLNKHGHPEHH